MASEHESCTHVPQRSRQLDETPVYRTTGSSDTLTFRHRSLTSWILYGTTLRVPGEFCLPDEFTPNPQIFLEEYREHMRNVKPVPVAHRYKKRAFFFKELHSCTHVFLQCNGTRSLERPYSGPHKVLERISNLNYQIEVNGAPRVVTTERLKPAHFIPEDLTPPALPGTVPLPNVNPEPPRMVLKTYARKKVTINTDANQVFYIEKTKYK